MATKRRKIPPRRINEPVPEWAQQLLAGKRPERDSEDGHSYFGWLYFNDPVPGLPPADSPEGAKLWHRATYADQAN